MSAFSPGLDDAAIERCLVLGLARQPLQIPDVWRREDPVRSTLGFLAVVAARRRYDRPAMPAAFRADVAPAAELVARFVDRSTRLRLRRSFGPNGVAAEDEVYALRVRDGLDRQGLLVHPFDELALQSLTEASPTRLAAAGEETAWADATPAERAKLLSALRAIDPGKARERCVAELREQTAAHRNKWLEALEVGLGPDDVAFLESLLDDRAKSVVQRVEDMLSRIAGTKWFEVRLEDALSRLQKSRGRFRRKIRLELDAPAHLREWARWDWMRTTFGAIAPDKVAQSLDIALQDLHRAVDDADLRRALYVAAIDALDGASAAAFAEEFDVDDLETVLATPELVATWDDDRRNLVAATLMPEGALEDPARSRAAATSFYRRLRRVLPREKAERVLAARNWKGWFEDARESEQAAQVAMAWLTALPGPSRAAFAVVVETLPAIERRRVHDYLSLLQQIEKAETRD